MLMKETEDDTNWWKDILCSGIERINTVKIPILLKAIYSGFFHRTGTNNLKICSNQPNMQKFLTSINKPFNCSDTCFDKNINLDKTTNKCINSCKDNEYNYTNNGICYNQCPENSHIIINVS